MKKVSSDLDFKDLHGFIDGELDPSRKNEVEAFLQSSPIDAERVEGWRRQRETLRAAFAAVDMEPVPPSVLVPAPTMRRVFRMARPAGLCAAFAAGAAAALTGAYVGGYLQAPPVGAPRPFSTSIAAETLADSAVAALATLALEDHAAAGRERATGAPATLIVPNLAGMGFALVGMRTVSPQRLDKAAHCLLYAARAVAPLALCITSVGGGGAAQRPDFRVSPALAGSTTAIAWRQRDSLYSLSGPMPPDRLRGVASKVSAEITAFDETQAKSAGY